MRWGVTEGLVAWWSRGSATRALVSVAARSGPGPFAAACAATLAAAVVPTLFYVASGRVVASVFAGSPDEARRWLVISAVLFVVQQALPAVRAAATADLGYRLEQNVRNRIMRATLDPIGIAHLEDPEINDQVARARAVATGQVSPLVATMSLFTLASRYLAATGAAVVLVTWKWWVGIALAV